MQAIATLCHQTTAGEVPVHADDHPLLFTLPRVVCRRRDPRARSDDDTRLKVGQFLRLREVLTETSACTYSLCRMAINDTYNYFSLD